ncbi:RidA family protein [Acinetobacter sp. B5B]|uniref:RidA family protein n=1 Tax=Acinetobacter baretiae TaxID=2605383 RepID=UPI0018C2624C|nr:RidA family protein [Acinetobacter baretiae]MBF7682677.1 RidA family protein [Acinetobacter baretiae]MBF7685661.1 RidA family protein [Acinetobacter baretiae]
MSITRLHKTSRFCEVAISADTIHLAGQLADDTSQDITSQTQQTLANIDRFLADAGAHKSDILSVTIYLKNIDTDYQAMNTVWDAWIDPEHPPARTCVEAKLYAPEVLVEMTAIAVKPR